MAELKDRAAGAPFFGAAEGGPGAPFARPDRAGQPNIPAATQLLAVAWLRWRMFANGFRRGSNSPRRVAGLVASIFLRLLIWPIFAMMALGPTIGCGYFAWRAIAHHHPQQLIPLLGTVFLGWQFVAVNGVSMAATLNMFDPASLLRYPLRFGRYLVLRLLLGLLTPSTVIGFLALFAAALGITIADRSLAPVAFLVLAIYAAMNLFFSRMVAVWLERWLATRRAREIFGVLMAFAVIGIQYLNFGARHAVRHSHEASTQTNGWLLTFLNGTHTFLNWLPPGYAAQTITLGAHPLMRLVEFAGLVLWTAAFFAAFALRLHKQFLGEYIAEGAPRSTAPARRSQPRTTNNEQRTTEIALPATSDQRLTTADRQLFSPTIAACLRKEWVYLRGNSNQIIAMLTPLIFVFLFARGTLAHHPPYLLAGAIGYATLGLLAALYNIFGADGAGIQLYLLAPVRLRDVIVAKNLASLMLLGAEALAAWCLAAFLVTEHIPLATQLSTFFWIIFMLFANLTLGTLRSIQSPRKISIAQVRRMRTPAANSTSGLLVLAVLFGSFALQFPVALLCSYYGNPWLAVLIFAPLAGAAVGCYAVLLLNADRLILTHRDTFAENLCGE